MILFLSFLIIEKGREFVEYYLKYASMSLLWWGIFIMLYCWAPKKLKWCSNLHNIVWDDTQIRCMKVVQKIVETISKFVEHLNAFPNKLCLFEKHRLSGPVRDQFQNQNSSCKLHHPNESCNISTMEISLKIEMGSVQRDDVLSTINYRWLIRFQQIWWWERYVWERSCQFLEVFLTLHQIYCY